LRSKTRSDLAYGQARFWQALHQRALKREAVLQEKVEDLEAKLRARERQLFGKKSERGRGSEQSEDGKEGEQRKAQRKRGQQPGRPGHGRRRQRNLPVIEEVYDLEADQRTCGQCQKPLEPFGGTEDSEIIEVEVRAYRRLVRRKRHRRTCSCPTQPGIVSATGPPRLIGKTGLGVSVWVKILLDKFLFQHPTHRLLSELRWTLDLDIAQGTVTGGLEKLAALFEPLMAAIVTKNLAEHHWHGDETGWPVFCAREGKVGYRWQLWVFQSSSAVVFKIDPSRAAKVPIEYFGETATGILSVDRYVAYKVLAKNGRIVLAFCWAHVRRDFIEVARNRGGAYEGWALQWVGRIGELYQLNKHRLAVLEDAAAFALADAKLRSAIEEMAKQRKAELARGDLHRACAKVLTSMENHWSGLLVFVDRPEVPMDNNTAERAHRGPVVGRKNYYGSGSAWSAELAATMFSVLQTLLLWKVNPRSWLSWYLESCAANGGRAPDDIAAYLPWNFSDEQREQLGAAKGPSRADTS
jgi:transposase